MASRPRLDQFKNAFARYLPQFQPPQRHNPQETVENRPFQSTTSGVNVADEKPLKPAVALTCDVVTVENPGSGDEILFDADLKARAAFLDGIEDDPEERIAVQEFDGESTP